MRAAHGQACVWQQDCSRENVFAVEVCACGGKRVAAGSKGDERAVVVCMCTGEHAVTGCTYAAERARV